VNKQMTRNYIKGAEKIIIFRKKYSDPSVLFTFGIWKRFTKTKSKILNY